MLPFISKNKKYKFVSSNKCKATTGGFAFREHRQYGKVRLRIAFLKLFDDNKETLLSAYQYLYFLVI